MNKLSNFHIILFLFFHFSCKSVKPDGQVGIQNEVSTEVRNNPEILLILFYINLKDSVYIDQSYINVGVYKGNETGLPTSYDGDLKLTFLDLKGDNCQEMIVANPLLRKVEYSSGDSTGKLIAEAVELEEAKFFIRLQWKDCFQQIKIEKLEEDKWELLKTFNYSKPNVR